MPPAPYLLSHHSSLITHDTSHIAHHPSPQSHNAHPHPHPHPRPNPNPPSPSPNPDPSAKPEQAAKRRAPVGIPRSQLKTVAATADEGDLVTGGLLMPDGSIARMAPDEARFDKHQVLAAPTPTP